MPDNHNAENESAVKKVNFGPGFNTVSIAYNGEEISKGQLILYLYDVIRLKKESEDLLLRFLERQKQIKGLDSQMKRRTFSLPLRNPPRGLAALLPHKKREYEQWLADAPKREAELKQKEAEEDARIAELQRKREALTQEGLSDLPRMNQVGAEYKELLERQILPPDYRKGDIPSLLVTYLFNGRAQTLTEAINLYHDEKHRKEMLSIAERQRAEAREAQQQQLAAALQQMELLREQSEMQQQALEAARETRDAARDIAFVAWTDFWKNS